MKKAKKIEIDKPIKMLYNKYRSINKILPHIL